MLTIPFIEWIILHWHPFNVESSFNCQKYVHKLLQKKSVGVPFFNTRPLGSNIWPYGQTWPAKATSPACGMYLWNTKIILKISNKNITSVQGKLSSIWSKVGQTTKTLKLHYVYTYKLLLTNLSKSSEWPSQMWKT